MYVAEEEEYDEIPEEVSRLLEREESTIQSYKESLEMINLGSECDTVAEPTVILVLCLYLQMLL